MFSKYQKINLLPFTKLPTNSKDPSKNPLGDREYLCSMSVMRTWTQQFQRQAVMAGHLPDRTCAVHKNIQTLIKLLESSAKEWMKNNIRVAAVGHASFPLKMAQHRVCARVCVCFLFVFVFVCTLDPRMCMFVCTCVNSSNPEWEIDLNHRFYTRRHAFTSPHTAFNDGDDVHMKKAEAGNVWQGSNLQYQSKLPHLSILPHLQ